MCFVVPKMYQESIYAVDYDFLKKKGIRCLLFDLDNTCVGYREKKPNLGLKKLFGSLKKKGFRVIIFSNASKKRLEPFGVLGIECHSSSKKPFSFHFKKLLHKYSYKREEVCIIGDQLFTDIIGGNRVGIWTCLVDPLSSEDFFLTKILRKMEGFAFWWMRRKGILKRGEYYE